MFPMTVTINTHSQLNAVLAVLNVSDVDTTGPAPIKPAAPAKETTAKKASVAEKVEAAPTQPTAEAGKTDAPEKKDEPSDNAAAPTYQATADAVTKLARTKGRDAAVAVLAKFGAGKLPDVKPEQFAAVIAECEKVGA